MKLARQLGIQTLALGLLNIAVAVGFSALPARAAGPDQLACQAKLSTKMAAEAVLTVRPGETVLFTELEGFRTKVTSLGDSRFELEAYDINEPSRSYTEGVLRDKADVLKWTLWRRDILLEISCHLAE